MGESGNGQVHVTRQSILELIRRREGIEREIKSLGDILKANNIGMTEPLTDAEGFPRNDIDVYQVRHARHGIICLQNDFKSLTKEIETNLEIYHQHQPQANGDGVRMDIEDSAPEIPALRPFVMVNEVTEGSPAFQAGVQVGDRVCSIGSINSENFSNLQDVGNLVQRSQGRALTVTVDRNGTMVQLSLIPGPWNGRGLLGCNIVPISS